MPAQERVKTDYPGVYYILVGGARGPERSYYIRYRRDGKMIDEKAGRQYRDDMTPAKASRIRADRIDGKDLPNKARREQERAIGEAWTIARLWEQYSTEHPMKGIGADKSRYERYLKDRFGGKEPQAIEPEDITKLTKSLAGKSPQTVKHVLTLLNRIINYGVKQKGTYPLAFQITKPRVQNTVTEDLTNDQIKALLQAIEEENNKQVGSMLKLALFTGMRRGEIFNLQWSDVDMNRGTIRIRDPKRGSDARIPMNSPARSLLQSIEQRGKNPLVFPASDGKQHKTVQSVSRRIRRNAGLPETFRPFHGLRHVYASMLASSGKVDMYVLQKLLTHKTPEMTQRYAHLRDEAMRRGADIASEILDGLDNKE